jgi:integrase/recombinase XerD
LLLKFALQEFYDDRDYKNISQNTINNYKEILKQFETYCLEQEIINVNDITKSTVMGYLTECKKKGNNATTTNSKLQRIRAFLNYLVEEEIIKTNPSNKIKKAQEDIKIEVFSDYHIKQMLNYYRRIKQRDKSFYAYRDYTMIVTFLSSGIRQTELTNLKWSDFDVTNARLRIFGKSRKQEIIPITDKLIRELSSYKLYCQQNFGERNLNEYIFTNRDNQKLTTNAVQNIFKRLAKVMNFRDVRVSSHTFRHTFCQKCIQAGMSTFAIQKLMRHSSIAVTERYAAMWGNDLKEQNDKFNPINSLDI